MDSTMSPGDCERYQDLLYSTLAHPHRRIVLRYLVRHPGPVPVSDLATEIELVEEGPPTGSASAGRGVSASLLGLYHVHVPKLVDAELVEFDPAESSVTLSTWAESVPLDSTVSHGLLGLPNSSRAESD
ncbi:DUF7344 domain-containing protein [Halorussus salinus]|uniref:DUF7344 domain-containing protein n=1 Tax=Halorussus salinus TaxID=1364935 RepID=UPI0010923B9D|nr:helix-turn-helix transcriptional regulator [Halorussus salinus]